MMLLTASVLSLYPTMTLEKPQYGSGVVSIKASGQAITNGNGKGKTNGAISDATLTLYGSVEAEGNGQLKLGDLGGSLQIGTANYTIASGSGEVNSKGTIEINAKTSDASKKLELVLHGDSKGTNVTFNSKESKLSSLYFLSLKGQAIVSMPPTTSTTSTKHDDDDTETTVTVTYNKTLTQTVTQTLNNTLTVTQTSTATQTVTPPAVTTTVTVTETNATTQTVTEPAVTTTVTITETVTSSTSNSTATTTQTSAITPLTFHQLQL